MYSCWPYLYFNVWKFSQDEVVWKILVNYSAGAVCQYYHYTEAVVKNPENTYGIITPSNTLLTESEFKFTCRKFGNRSWCWWNVKMHGKDGQRPTYNQHSRAASPKVWAKLLAAATTYHCTFHSDHWINKNAPVQILYVRGICSDISFHSSS